MVAKPWQGKEGVATIKVQLLAQKDKSVCNSADEVVYGCTQSKKAMITGDSMRRAQEMGFECAFINNY